MTELDARSILDNPNAKLTLSQVKEILEFFRSNAVQNAEEMELHDEFGQMCFYDGEDSAWSIALLLLSRVAADKKEYESKALKPCPECGKTSRSGYVGVWARYQYGNLHHFIKCEYCGYKSKEASTEAQARRNWNNGLLKQCEWNGGQ